jgi:hypothetical protein
MSNKHDQSCSFLLLLGFSLLLPGLFLLLLGSVEILSKFFESIHCDFGGGGDAGCELVGSSCEVDSASVTFPNSA